MAKQQHGIPQSRVEGRSSVNKMQSYYPNRRRDRVPEHNQREQYVMPRWGISLCVLTTLDSYCLCIGCNESSPATQSFSNMMYLLRSRTTYLPSVPIVAANYCY